jgi:acetyl-CoA C-acetyltransferase
MPEIPRNAEPRTGLSMGEHAAIMAKEWGIPREEQDELAVHSHRALAAAYESGYEDDLVVPFLGLERDHNLRPDSSVEKLAKLRPVFGGAEGTMTAGNSTPLSDGASTVLLASEEWARARDLPIQAWFVDAQTAGVDHVHKREGLLMAPAYAMPKLLARNGLKLQDFDYYEIHEAFASQVLCTLRAWESPEFCRERLGLDEPLGAIDRDKLNVRGGSLGAGHPFGATGGRIVANLAKMLAERGSGRGVISICAAGGLGVVAIMEAAA